MKERIFAYIILCIVCSLFAWKLFPSSFSQAPYPNDNQLHYCLIQYQVEAIKSNHHPIEHWFPLWAMGFPVFHFYQFFPHTATSILALALDKIIPIQVTFNLVRNLLMCAFPLFFYLGLRLFGFSYFSAAITGCLASTFFSDSMYAIGFDSYTWAGYGLYTQLWGVVLLPITLGLYYRYLKGDVSFWYPAIVHTLNFLSHIIFGYIAGLSVLLMPLCFERWSVKWRKYLRLLLPFFIMAILLTYFLIPFMKYQHFIDRSFYEYKYKWDSFGLSQVTSWIFSGFIFDYQRLPVLSVLTLIGLAGCLFWSRERYRYFWILFAFWLIAFAGRESWGPLYKIFPMSEKLHAHRLVNGVEMAAVFLIASLFQGIYYAINIAKNWKRLVMGSAFGVLCLFLTVPSILKYLDNNCRWIKETDEYYTTDRVQPVIESVIKTLPPGRIYAGLPINWGKKFTIGHVPFYHTSSHMNRDCLSYMYMAMSLNTDFCLHFSEENELTHYIFNTRWWIVPQQAKVPQDAVLRGVWGTVSLYELPYTRYFDFGYINGVYFFDKSALFDRIVRWLTTLEIFNNGYMAFWGPDMPRFPPYDVPEWSEQRAGYVIDEDIGINYAKAYVQVNKPCIMVWKSTFFPYWQATVDGQSTECYMVSPSFTALRINPGRHNVEFKYVLPRWKEYLFFMWTPLLAFLIAGTGLWNRWLQKWL